MVKINCNKCGMLMPYNAITDTYTCLNCNNVKKGKLLMKRKHRLSDAIE